jgi:23S rRNA (cytidine2498-2'-O)-methyltransferase
MAPEVLAQPNFTHVRRRSTQVRRREFRRIRWLTVDMNVAPTYTLDAVEGIVTHSEVHIRGMLLTLKLPEWSLTKEIPRHLERIRSWGFNEVQARQLQHNRQEFCVAALKRPFRRDVG